MRLQLSTSTSHRSSSAEEAAEEWEWEHAFLVLTFRKCKSVRLENSRGRVSTILPLMAGILFLI